MERERGGEGSIVESFGALDLEHCFVRRKFLKYILPMDCSARCTSRQLIDVRGRSLECAPSNTRDVPSGTYLIKTFLRR